MAEKLAPKPEGPAPERKTEGIVNLWRSTRSMQIWCQVECDGFAARAIGEEVTLLVFHAGKELWRWSAPRSWWDEQLRGAGALLSSAGWSVPRETLRALLGELDVKRPALVRAASTLAAATQANMEAEAAERPDRLRVSGDE